MMGSIAVKMTNTKSIIWNTWQIIDDDSDGIFSGYFIVDYQKLIYLYLTVEIKHKLIDHDNAIIKCSWEKFQHHHHSIFFFKSLHLILCKDQYNSQAKRHSIFYIYCFQYSDIQIDWTSVNKMAQYGYDKERFVNLTVDEFDCIICSEIAKNPTECQGCGKMFCKVCINDWIKKQPGSKCPNRCKAQITAIKSKALLRMYNNLNIKCSNPSCEKVLALQKIQEHQISCLKPDCFNAKFCNNKANESLMSQIPCCSHTCYILSQLCKYFGNNQKLFEIVTSMSGQARSSPIQINSLSSSQGLCWDTSRFGSGVVFSENKTHVYLKQEAYVFRNVFANTGFSSGINYWEIIADSRTQNELKIGITGDKNIQMNGAFCDHPIGYAFYGLGQLRNGSNATGAKYGKRFKKNGVLGVCLNMVKGTLSFSLDGQFMGVAFTSEALKQGTYYPAVSLLHCAACKIKGGVPLPACFK